MEQRSVLTRTTRPNEEHTKSKYGWNRWKWMLHFFTEDVSPDNSPVIELQRRAIWIDLALILQSPNEIDHNVYMLYLTSFGSLFSFFLILGFFISMFFAFRLTSLNRYAR